LKWHLYIAADTLACGTKGDILFTQDKSKVTCKKCIKAMNYFDALLHEVSSYTYLGD
jgi:hypothetical protein